MRAVVPEEGSPTPGGYLPAERKTGLYGAHVVAIRLTRD